MSTGIQKRAPARSQVLPWAAVLAMAIFFVTTASASANVVQPYWNDPTGFATAAGTGPGLATEGFDAIAANTDVSGQSFNGATLASIPMPPNSLPVVAGNSTYTPSGFTDPGDPETHKLFPTSGTNVVSPGGLALVPGSDLAERDSMRLTFNPPISAFAFDVLFQSYDYHPNVDVRILPTNGTEETYSTPGNERNDSPPGDAVFAGFVSTVPVTRVEIRDLDGNSDRPDSNIGLDTLRLPIYDAPATASQLNVSLVPNFRQTISSTQCSARGGTTSSHGAPLALLSCNPPAYISATAARLGPQSQSSAQLTVMPGDLSTPANEADVSLSVVGTDVRDRQSGSDYAPSSAGPDTTLVLKMRVNDTDNGSWERDGGTSTDFDFGTPVDCVETAGPEGSNCQASITANALTPGAIKEGKRMVVQSFRLRFNDSGLNGSRGDSDDRTFAQQGIYVP
jgi:hypothetical protein